MKRNRALVAYRKWRGRKRSRKRLSRIRLLIGERRDQSKRDWGHGYGPQEIAQWRNCSLQTTRMDLQNRGVTAQEMAGRISKRPPKSIEKQVFLVALKGVLRNGAVGQRGDVGAITERERRIGILYYQDGLTQRNIGDQMGIGAGRVGQLLQQLLFKIRQNRMPLHIDGTTS